MPGSDLEPNGSLREMLGEQGNLQSVGQTRVSSSSNLLAFLAPSLAAPSSCFMVKDGWASALSSHGSHSSGVETHTSPC
jgi:hypothetical protein